MHRMSIDGTVVGLMNSWPCSTVMPRARGGINDSMTIVCPPISPPSFISSVDHDHRCTMIVMVVSQHHHPSPAVLWRRDRENRDRDAERQESERAPPAPQGFRGLNEQASTSTLLCGCCRAASPARAEERESVRGAHARAHSTMCAAPASTNTHSIAASIVCTLAA